MDYIFSNIHYVFIFLFLALNRDMLSHNKHCLLWLIFFYGLGKVSFNCYLVIFLNILKRHRTVIHLSSLLDKYSLKIYAPLSINKTIITSGVKRIIIKAKNKLTKISIFTSTLSYLRAFRNNYLLLE